MVLKFCYDFFLAKPILSKKAANPRNQRSHELGRRLIVKARKFFHVFLYFTYKRARVFASFRI